MAFLYSPEQEEFKNTLRKFFTDLIPSEYFKTRMESSTTTDDELWDSIDELGLFPYFAQEGEDSGSFHDLGLIAFECGRAAFTEPLVDALFSNCFVLGRWASETALKNLSKNFPNITQENLKSGDLLITVAPPCSQLTQKKAKLSGDMRFVPAAEAADGTIAFLGADSYFISFLDLEDKKSASTAPEQSVDRVSKYHSVSLSNALGASLDDDAKKIPNAIQCLRALELAGCAERALEMTVEYVKTRKQFGVAVGGFQAVQHKAAEMLVSVESMKQLGMFASWAADNSEEQFSFASQAALAYACEAAPLVIEQAIQLHGGIGFTWEYDLHLFLRKAKMISTLWKPTETEAIDFLDAALGQLDKA